MSGPVRKSLVTICVHICKFHLLFYQVAKHHKADAAVTISALCMRHPYVVETSTQRCMQHIFKPLYSNSHYTPRTRTILCRSWVSARGYGSNRFLFQSIAHFADLSLRHVIPFRFHMPISQTDCKLVPLPRPPACHSIRN